MLPHADKKWRIISITMTAMPSLQPQLSWRHNYFNINTALIAIHLKYETFLDRNHTFLEHFLKILHYSHLLLKSSFPRRKYTSRISYLRSILRPFSRLRKLLLDKFRLFHCDILGVIYHQLFSRFTTQHNTQIVLKISMSQSLFTCVIYVQG